jgi:hypothetical protein
LTKGAVTTILKELDETGYGEHVIIIHPDLQVMRKIYCRFTKNQLVDNNEIVLLLPHYETPDAVKNNLQESKSNDSSSSNNTTGDIGCIDVQKHEKEGSLIVIDSIKAHFHSDSDIKSFIKQLVQHAENTGKRGVSILVDMGSFYHYGKIDELIEHELSIPSNYYDDIKLKRFCIYHEKDFDRLKEEHKQTLSQHHGKELVVVKEE